MAYKDRETRLAYGEAYRITHKRQAATYATECYKTHKDTVVAEYNRIHKEGKKVWRKGYKEQERLNNARYRKKHKGKIRISKAQYRRTHLPEHTAGQAARQALILGATIGNLAEIKEIYRRAKEDPRVRCYLCGRLIAKDHRHVDHIMPLSRSGAHRPSNLAVACDTCNLDKHDKMPEEIGVLI